MTPKQAAFVSEYLIDKNATQAAIRAGYSAKTAAAIGDENLRKPEIKAAVRAGLKELAKRTETEAEWVRRRLKQEANSFTKDSSHSARVRALEILAKMNGMFEIDNKQKTDPLREFLAALPGAVIGVVEEPARDD